MKRPVPSAQSAASGRQFSAFVRTEASPGLGSRRLIPPTSAAFTLIELLAVVALIGVLAGLTLAGLGYVQQKSAHSRAEAEVAALSAAIEGFKMDYGSYPDSSTSLLAELTGGAGATVNTNRKVFFEVSPRMVTNNQIMDPWGAPYNYTTNASRNTGFFDLWTVPPKARDESDWIHN